jgi:hypothetical protein
LDVAWLESPENYLESIYRENPEIHVCIQDSTIRTSTKSLCMGFVSFRKSTESLNVINVCRAEHSKALVESSNSGDDGVVTNYFNLNNSKHLFFLLPQVSFPIGLLANTYLDRSPYLGLVPVNPFIFHANYLVGAKRKAIMMTYVMRRSGLNASVPLSLTAELFLRKLLLPVKKIISNS